MPTVYITERTSGKDFSGADRFGHVEFLFRKGVYPDNLDQRIPDMVDIARRKLANFDPNSDFILPVGDPVGIAIVFMILGHCRGRVSVLKYDRQTGIYYVAPITIREETSP